MSNPTRRQFSAFNTSEGNILNIPKHKFSNYTPSINSGSDNGKINVSTGPKIQESNLKEKTQRNNPKISSLAGNIVSKSNNSDLNKKYNANVKDLSPNQQTVSPKNAINAKSKQIKQQKQLQQNNSLKNDYDSGNQSTKTPVRTYQINPATHTMKILQKCAICETPTQKCCSLCRKVFYCSPQHQQVDWHTKHKSVCEGKVAIQKEKPHSTSYSNPYGSNSTNNQFVFYSNNPMQYNQFQKSIENIERQLEIQTIQRFLQLLEQRLVMRAKIMNQVAKLNQRTPLIVRQSLVRQTQQLLLLSGKITNEEYKPSFSKKITKKDIMQYSSQHWGSQVFITQHGIKLQYIADMILMSKIYHLCAMSKQTRELIISIGKIIQDPEQKKLFLQSAQPLVKNISNKKLSTASSHQGQLRTGSVGPVFNSTNTAIGQQFIHSSQDPLSKAKNLILESIIQLSEAYNIDKTSQSAYKLYIKKIEISQGIWQQIYAYFNIGVWYMDKTYFDKSVKSFLYALELLDSHKKNISESIVFKADCLYNVAQGYWVQGQKSNAIENMQQCYRVRVNGIGKNSMECSNCLFKLSKWYRDIQKWEECLQYLDECHRVRKLYQNQPIYEQKLEQIRQLIIIVYQQIKREKERNSHRLEPRVQRYYEDLITEQREQEHRELLKKNQQAELLPKGSVAARLFRDDKQYVHFKVVLSEQVYNELTSDQVKYLAQLFELTDKRMEKSEAIQTITQSKFVSCLNSEQREKFFKENQIGKDTKRSFQ